MSDPMRVSLRADAPLFREREIDQLFDAEISGMLTEIASTGQNMLVSETPRGHSGALRGSYFAELRRRPGLRAAVVSSSAFYAPIVERGRRPGRRPPAAALALWVRSKFGIVDGRQLRRVTFLVARKIGRVGTRGTAMFFKAAQRLEPYAQARAAALAERLARRLEGR